jgi:putative CRISPR-associated protein (TIGR02619 family)
MQKNKPQPVAVLVCTVGTSMLTNLENKALSHDADRLAEKISALQPHDRACGAEINSCHSMILAGVARDDCTLVFIHSETPDARRVAEVLKRIFTARNHPVEIVEVPGLQDENPEKFRTEGLRNLANKICDVLRRNGTTQCAINATGGYKAQIAVAILIGQSMQVPVYYMHERFNSIISMPPMPVAPDMNLWTRHKKLFYQLEDHRERPVDEIDYQPTAELEGLVEVVHIDGRDYAELTATGVAFHRAILQRPGADHTLMPRDAKPEEKERPNYKQGEAHVAKQWPKIEPYLEKLTKEIGPVKCCVVNYYNPDLPSRNEFKLAGDCIEGTYSNGTFTVRFEVQSTAELPAEMRAVLESVNKWAAAQ